MLARVELGYACFGIVIGQNDIVIESAPIGKWMIGKEVGLIIKWVDKKKGKLTIIDKK